MSDNEYDNEDKKGGFDLTGFLFGNVDETGRLEDDVLDGESKRHLASLAKLGLGSMLEEIVEEAQEEEVITEEVDEDETVKSPSAVDYSDMDELADEEPKIKEETASDYDADDEGPDTKLMPPPPVPSSASSQPARKRKLDTPLAAMLPEKYSDVDVTQLFPDFRVDKTLRFSRLFGGSKQNSLPHIWRNVKKRKKKRKNSTQKDNSDSGSDNDVGLEARRGWTFNFASAPRPEQILSDDEEKLMKPMDCVDETQKGETKEGEGSENGPRVADWRFGPAQLWYDMLDVGETGEGFDYGFTLKDKSMTSEDGKKGNEVDGYPDDAFLMVSQLHWEDDVVWNGDDIKHKVLQKLNSKTNAAGWLPSSANRTAQAFSQPGKGLSGVRLPQPFPPLRANIKPASLGGGKGEGGGDDTWYSIFPVENEELVYGAWEKQVVWDHNSMESLPHPPILTLDPNDENIILGIPNDVDSAKQRLEPPVPAPKVKIPHPHVKKSKILLGKAGVINVLEEDAPPPPPKSPHTDPFNVSNDSYYMPKSSDTLLKLKMIGCNIMQHSTPIVELRVPFVQTHMGAVRLRNFHRPILKRFSHGGLSHPGPHPVYPLAKQIRKKHKLRESERQASGGGDVFFMRTPEDLTGKDGEIVLLEFCEEHPPLISQVGMCSKIKNYYKRKAGKDTGPGEYKYGEVAYAHTSPFLGVMLPGTCIQTMENNMYRAPIYPHNIPHTDFLVIRTRHQYFVREADSLFAAGQLCPLYEVPGPNSKRANNFVRDFLQVFIYRLFWKSSDTPKRIRMDDIRRAFPSHSESSIRKRLKLCADFKRTGSGSTGLCFTFFRDPRNPNLYSMDSNWWVIKPDFRLPTEEEIRAMVSPEQCCAYFSMIAAEQRLKDAGYGEKFLLTPVDDDDEELQLKMEDEVKVAPWNTTRAYIQAMKGKCLLQLTGPADPTGCGEGFSYVRIPNKPTQSKEEQESQPKRIVTGTDADLRRLSLNNAKALLRKYGVPEEEIKKLSRWEVIDVVRTLSTEKAKAGEEGMNKFSRGNRFSIAEHQERYKEECQRIFDLQNRVLSSFEVLSTDEGESSDEDSSDIEEMGKNIENMLANKKTSTQLSLEKEEQERQELRKLLMSDSSEQDPKKPKEKKKEPEEEQPSMSSVIAQPGRVLKIYRTFRDGEGKEYTRTEVVRKPGVIDMYCKIRSSKDEVFIKQYATMDENLKEEMKREKRRLQEQLRRIKRNQERTSFGSSSIGPSPGALASGSSLGSLEAARSFLKPPSSSNQLSSFAGLGPMKMRDSSESPPPIVSKPISVTPPSARRKKPSKLKPDLKLKCGACGQVGHMRTNKACPMYSGPDKPVETSGRVVISAPSSPPSSSLNLDEPDDEIDKQSTIAPDEEDLVNIDGTKVKLSSKLLKQADELKKRALVVKVPRDAVGRNKKRKAQDLHCDYLKRHQRPANRRRTDPVVVLSTILESILNEMRDLPDVQPFLFPVNAKAVPDYYKIIQKPMDLQTIRDSLRMKKYQSREEFLADVNQIVENSTLYNGGKSMLTVAARRMLELCVERLADKEERLMRLEKAINPLLDDNDQVALTFILDNVVNNKLKGMTEAWPFVKPVDKKKVKDYYAIISEPMDLETVEKKVKSHKYHSRKDFLDDIEKILTNCITYNGRDSPYTQKAEILYRVAKSTLEEYDEHLTTLEKSISLVQERALEQVEDSLSQWDEADASMAEQGGELELLDMKEGEEPGVLEEDLQFSSEEELEEVTSGIPTSPGLIDHLGVGLQTNPDDDSQQVAEAMVQLAYYTQVDSDQQQEETMEVDPNYDPSEFLGGLKREKEAAAKLDLQDDVGVNDLAVNDLAVSDSDEEAHHHLVSIEPKPDEDDNELWF